MFFKCVFSLPPTIKQALSLDKCYPVLGVPFTLKSRGMLPQELRSAHVWPQGEALPTSLFFTVLTARVAELGYTYNSKSILQVHTSFQSKSGTLRMYI